MELSVNYSLELASLLGDGKVRVDRIKCPDWPDMIPEARAFGPVYVHFPLDAGSITGRPPNFAAADVMARDTNTPYINMHLVTWQRDFPEYPADSADPKLLRAVTDQMIRDVSAAMDAVGRERVIVENIPYFGSAGEFHRASVEPQVIRTVVEQTGAGFLLDVSHARIAAHYLNVDPHKYVSDLPVERLRELHITGIRTIENRLADHMELGEKDWAWAGWAMDRIRAGDWSRPWTVALEYGGVGEPFKWRSDRQVLADQVPRLYDLVHGVAQGVD